MFYYYIYSIYINTYINILHVQPILKRGERIQKEKETRMRTCGGKEVGEVEAEVAHH